MKKENNENNIVLKVLNAVLLVGLCGLLGYYFYNHYTAEEPAETNETDTSEEDSNQSEDGDASEESENEETEETEAVSFSVKRLASAYSEETEGITVTATVNPTYTTQSALTWSLTWASENEEDVNACVTLNISEDTLTVDVVKVQQFDTQIILTATSVANTDVSANLSIDCYARTASINLSSKSEEEFIVNQENNTITMLDATYANVFDLTTSGFELAMFNFSANKTGTVRSNTSVTLMLSLSDELSNLLVNAGYQVNDSIDVTSDNRELISQLHDLINTPDNNLNSLVEYFNQTSEWLCLEIIVTETYGEETVNETSYVYTISGFDMSDYYAVESVTLSDSSIIF